jgi:hypothetical protein
MISGFSPPNHVGIVLGVAKPCNFGSVLDLETLLRNLMAELVMA